MRHVLIALCLAGLLLGGCGKREVEAPPLNAERIALNRATVARCVETNWAPCRGGFVEYLDEAFIRRVVVDDPAVEITIGSDGTAYDAVKSSYLTANSLQGAAGDTYLNGLNIVLPSDPAWEQMAVRHARQRTQ